MVLLISELAKIGVMNPIFFILAPLGGFVSRERGNWAVCL